jgi:hypothetical protein
MILVNPFCTFSINAKNKMPGPIVIHRKSNEGGYLLRFKKDRKVYTVPLGCDDHGNGSPYRFVNLRTMNNRTIPPPILNNIFLLHTGSTPDLYSLPKQ